MRCVAAFHYFPSMLKKLLLTIFSSLLFAGIIAAQKPAKAALKKAKTHFEHQKFEEALDIYFKVQKFHPLSLGDRIRMAVCYYETGKIEDAMKYLNSIAETSKKPDPVVALCLARCHHEKYEFREAIRWYKKYLSLTTGSEKNRRNAVKDDIKRCAKGMYINNFSEDNFVQNLGENINGKGDEFAPLLSPATDEKMYFSSSRETSLGGLRNEKGLRDEKNGTFSSDIFSAVLENGEWGNVKALSYLLNGPRYDVALDFSENGKLMYYFQGYNLFSGEILVDTFKTFESRTTGKNQFSGPTDALHGDNHLFFFHDTLLLFSSRRNGGFGGADLYFCKLKHGKWQQPVNLGKEINSPYDEISPFLAEDGRTLFFSSNSTESIGGFDVFKSEFVDDSLSWSRPENLGIPVNSAADDAFFRPNAEGSMAYYSSGRKDGYGQRDIYSVNFKNTLACQNTRNSPDLFFKVSDLRQEQLAGQDENKPKAGQTRVFKYTVQPIAFDKEADITGSKNQKTVSTLVTIMKNHPETKLRLASHSHEISGITVDVFNSIKRLDKIAELLEKEGIEPNRIEMLGCGGNYPLALNVQDGTPSAIGQKLNRRIDLLFQIDNKNIKIENLSFEVPDYLQSGEYFRFKNLDKGLSFRVEIAALKQMYNGDIISRYPDFMIEKNASESLYHYTIGLFSNFERAEALRLELAANGIEGAKVVPFVAGWKTEGEEAKKHLAQYPGLQQYISKLH